MEAMAFQVDELFKQESVVYIWRTDQEAAESGCLWVENRFRARGSLRLNLEAAGAIKGISVAKQHDEPFIEVYCGYQIIS